MKLFSVISPILFALIVTILGFLTPGYNHLNHTMSRLAIERYGWVQTLNFLQFAVGMYVSGINLASIMKLDESKRVIRSIFSFCALLLILAALVPTDPIENVRFQFSLLTPTGIIHAGVVIIFLIISPFGIYRLSKALASENKFERYSALTAFMGYVALAASILWFVFFTLGIFLEYRGIFQKIIAAWTITWLIIIQTPVYTRMRTKNLTA